MNRETITQYLNLLDGWVTYQYTYLKEGLALCDEFKDMIQSCELRPLFYLNLIDLLNPKEPITSKMLERILSYNNKDGYVVLQSFCHRFLEASGFDCRIISEPEIIAERNGHIDIRITEEGKYAVIIENKLKGADFQRNQIARYIQTIKEEGFQNEQIYIVILPQYKNIRIRPSVWRLPPDYKSTTNANRKCGIHDDKLCWCDFPDIKLTKDEVKHCKTCVTYWDKEFADRTQILHQDFTTWLIDIEDTIPRRELNVRSAILQFADYLNGLYNTRLDQKLNEMITDFLRDKLELGNSVSDWKKLNSKIEEVKELEEGLKTLRTEMSSDLIDMWHEKLLKKWPMLRNEPRKSFGILIQGMWFGCWWAEESDDKDSPIWGVYCDSGNPTPRQLKIAQKIIANSGLSNEVSDNQWMTWSNTIKGEQIADKLYTVAEELGYLK